MSQDLGEELFDALAPQNDPDVDGHLALFCFALMASTLAPVYEWVREREDMGPWAILFNADLAPITTLAWLAQFVGAVLEPNASEQQHRDAIKLPAGWARGRPSAIVQAAQRTLTGAMTVRMTERADGNPHLLRVRTLTSETPDADVVEADIRTQKPAGLTLDFAVIAGMTYTELAAAGFASYAALAAGFDDYDDLHSTPP